MTFLKRRWILLSCALLLLACSITNWGYCLTRPAGNYVALCLLNGDIRFEHLPAPEPGHFPISPTVPFVVDVPLEILAPSMGSEPVLLWDSTGTWIAIPVWLPLSVVLGWLVFRELRWRERRAKAAERSTNAEPSTLN